MAVYITDESARAFWDAAESLDGQTRRVDAVDLLNATAAIEDLKGLGVPRCAIVDKKLHVLVGSQSLRRHSAHVVSHLCSDAMPCNAFRAYTDSVNMASPEFLFVRMARKLPLAEAVKLGYELCGTYVVNPADPARNYRQALTTPEALHRFIAGNDLAHGCKKASRALSHVLPDSNSPMETALAMLLCLPLRYGGFGLPRPQMNYPVKLSAAQAREAGRGRFKCDLYWKDSRFALEYYGRDWHTGASQVAYDVRRQSDLRNKGIDMMAVTYEQMETVEQMAILAKKVARALGARMRNGGESALARRRDLHRLLVAPHRSQDPS